MSELNTPLTEKESEEKQQRENTLKTEFADKFQTNCRLLVTHFEELLGSAKITSSAKPIHDEDGAEQRATNESTSKRELIYSRQEKMRRDGLHLILHSESLSAIAEGLLTQIQDMRINLVIGNGVGIAPNKKFQKPAKYND